MEYTKGEWTQYGNKIKVHGSGTIAVCPSPTDNEGVLEFVANAHLIAAAPEMYEALKQLVDSWVISNGKQVTDSAYRAIYKALTKAEVK